MTRNMMLELAMSGLLAATALVPAAASATGSQQDGGHQDRGGEERGRPDGQNGRSHSQQRAAQPAPAQPQAVQAQVQVQAQRPSQVQAQAQAQAQAGRRPDGRGPDARGPGGDQRGQGYEGRSGAGYRGQPNGGYDGRRDQGQPVSQQQARGGYQAGDPHGGDQRYDRSGGGAPQRERPDGYRGQGYAGQGYGQPQARQGYVGQGYGGRDQGYRGQPNGGQRYEGQHYSGQRGWNTGWRQDRRFDWSGYRQQNYRLFGLPRYAAPYGWHYGYRRFSIGVSLNAALFGQGYWISNPWAYRLPPAYGDLRWVRYYNDALLVDLDSGQVVDTVYGIFY